MCAQAKEDNLEAAKQFNADLMQAREQIKNIILTISEDHSKSIEVVTEQLHLGGHAIKQQQSPGINNTYLFCAARAENECTYVYIFISKLLLTTLHLGEDDNTKDHVKEIINKAKRLNGYKYLSDDEQQVLIDELQQAHDEMDTGTVRKPMLQVHDIQTTFDCISQEVFLFISFYIY